MDNSLKKRLTGAIILVVIAVALVPELLRGPRDAIAPGGAGAGASPQAAAVAGTDGAPLRSYEIDLSGRGATGSGAAPGSAAADPATTTPRDASAPQGTAAASAPPIAGAQSGPGDGAGAPAPAPPATEAAPDPATASGAAPGPSPPAERGVATRPGYAAQLGSFAARPAADALAAALQREGFPAFVTPVRSGGQQLWRVRVGPVETRNEAQTLVKRLQSAGRGGVIVTHP